MGNPEQVEVLRARVAMLTQASNSSDRTHAIVGAHTQDISENVKARLPSMEAIKRGIRRVRQGGNLPAPQRDNQAFQIPAQ